MYKIPYLPHILIVAVFLLFVMAFTLNRTQAASESFGAFGAPFVSRQLATSSLTNGYVLQTDGKNNTWIATSSLGISGGSSASSTLLVDNNWWSGVNRFTNASTSLLTATSSVWLTSLATPAGTILAVDPDGKIIATTTSAGGVTSVTATYPILSSGGATPVISWSGLSTTTNLVSGGVVYASGVGSITSIATTTVSCSGAASCTSFFAIGPSPITITATDAWPFVSQTYFGSTYQATSSNLAASSTLFTTSHFVNGFTASSSASMHADSSDLVFRIFENSGGEYQDMFMNSSGNLVFDSPSQNPVFVIPNGAAQVYAPNYCGLDSGGGLLTSTCLENSTTGEFDFNVNGVQMLSLTNTTQDDVVFNEGSGDVDVRMEGNNDAFAFFLDAGEDLINITKASTTHATSTNFDIKNLFTFNGVTSSTWAGFCATITGSAGLCDSSDDTGSGVWPFTPSTYSGVANQSTTTPLWLKDTMVLASTTFFTQASTTMFSNTGSTWLSGLTGTTILALDANSKVYSTATSTLNIGGNAGTATALETARTINGVSFNGTANIVVASTTLLGDTNWWTGTQRFTQASTSLLTATSSVWLTGVTASRPLYVDANGLVGSAGTGTSGNCVQWGANNTLADAGSACGTGTGGAWPFTPSSYNGVANQSTTTPFWLKDTMVIASTTFFTQASTTMLTNTGNTYFTGITSALVTAGAGGLLAEYAGASCTNQFPRSVDALGAWTCATVGSADVAGLDISDDTNLAATYPIILTGDTLSFPATSTLYGTGAGGNILAWSNGEPAWIATTSIPLGGDVTGTLSATVVGNDSHDHTSTTISGIDISADTNLTAGDNLTLTDDDLDLDATLTGLTSITVTNASTTNFTASLYASSTKYFGAGLADCNTGNMLTWTAGVFGCEDDTSGGGGAWPWDLGTNYGVSVNSTSTPTWFTAGMHASSTSHFVNSTTTLATIGTAWLTSLFIGADTIAEYISDTAGAFFTGNTETGITVTYQDADNTVDVVCDTATSAVFGCLSATDWAAFNGRVSTTSIDTLAEMEVVWGSINVIAATEIDSCSEFAAIMAGETGTCGSLVLSVGPTFTGLASFANASSSILSNFGTAYFGGTATSSFDSAGKLTLLNGSTTLQSFSSSVWFTGITNGVLSTNAAGLVVATTSIGTNYLTGTLATINTQAITAGGTFTITAASSTLLADSNWWTGTNRFKNASTSMLTATSSVWFTGLTSAVIIADANGLLGEASTQTCTNQFVRAMSAAYVATCATVQSEDINLGDSFVWTAAHDFGGATDLEIPNGTGPTVNVTGEIAIDTTSDQFIYYGSASKRVLQPYDNLGFAYATTTWTGTTTLRIGPSPAAITVYSALCETNTGTVGVRLYDGTNSANYIPTASTTINENLYTSNNTFTKGETIRVDIGTPASSPQSLSCRFLYTYTAD